MSSKFAGYYLDNTADRSFLDSHFQSEQDIKEKARQLSGRSISPALFEILKTGSGSSLLASAAREFNLARIAESLTPGNKKVLFCCGGQQPVILGGPLMIYLKAQSLIEYARRITDLTGIACVPLFWVQSEDHDVEEIKNCYLPSSGRTSGDTQKFSADLYDSRKSLMHHTVNEKTIEVLDSFLEGLAGLNLAPEKLEMSQALLRHHYQAGKSIVTAFQGLMEDLFAEDGLIVFNPRQAIVAALLKPIYSIALQSSIEIDKLLQSQVARLNEAGLEEQVALRDGVALMNYHLSCVEGPRYRIKKINDRWHTQGYEHCLSEEEITETIRSSPLRFSSSALIRPVIQDYLFPTAGFIGGNAEISYMAQITPLYGFYRSKGIEVVQPVIAPRKSDYVIRSEIAKLIDDTGFSMPSIGKSEEEIIKTLNLTTPQIGLPPETLKSELAKKTADLMAGLRTESEPFSAELKTPLKKTEENLNFLIQKFIERYTLARNSKSTAGDVKTIIRKILGELKPNGIQQERIISLFIRYSKDVRVN